MSVVMICYNKMKASASRLCFHVSEPIRLCCHVSEPIRLYIHVSETIKQYMLKLEYVYLSAEL